MAGTLVLSLTTAGYTTRMYAQGWSAEASAGRLVYDPASSTVATNHAVAGLRYDTRRDTWVYGDVATPFGDGGTFWGAIGTGGRLIVPASQARPVTVGADVGVHGFIFRDRIVDDGGSGGALEGLPFVRVSGGTAFIEGRAGWRGQTLSFTGIRESRGVFETGARAGYGTTLRVEGDVRWIRATEGTYPSIGATVFYEKDRFGLWGRVGKWLADDLTNNVWAAGAGVNVSERTTLWGRVHQEAPDPLYWNPSRRTWSVGLTQRLGRIPVPLVPTPRSQAGTVIIRLSAADAPAGSVAIGGDFNNWQPAPMQREGSEWIVRLALAPGVYHYAFRSEKADWFVPPSTAGRRGDGMGGYHAVLVVN